MTDDSRTSTSSDRRRQIADDRRIHPERCGVASGAASACKDDVRAVRHHDHRCRSGQRPALREHRRRHAGISCAATSRTRAASRRSTAARSRTGSATRSTSTVRMRSAVLDGRARDRAHVRPRARVPPKDPMTYIAGRPAEAVPWHDAPCGTHTARELPVLRAAARRTRIKHIYALFGAGQPTPPDGRRSRRRPTARRCSRGSRSRSTRRTTCAIDKVELCIDGAMTDAISAAPCAVRLAPPMLAIGAHAIEIHAIDVQGCRR